MNQHAPAPWTAEFFDGLDESGRSHKYVPVIQIKDATGNEILELRVLPLEGYGHKPEDNAQQEANARLIAAAPDLLAALSEIVRKGYLRPGKHEDVSVHPALIESARAAIARATDKPESQTRAEILAKLTPKMQKRQDLFTAMQTARTHMINGDPVEAESALEMALKLSPSVDVKALLRKSKDEISIGSPERAEHLLDIALHAVKQP